VTKRSPILGYNHNVRHRGLVFHVQTEDSGVLSPHLFTHLFHGGVIVATRKLVYDVGAVEDVIKNLMQAQHKAVLKELKKGSFDEKIDAYLGGTPGLLPRETDIAEDRASAAELTPVPAAPPAPEPPPRAAASDHVPVPRTATTFSAAPPPPKPQTDRIPVIQSRTGTADRTTKFSADPPPPPPGLDEPTLTDDAEAVAAAVQTMQSMNSAPTVPTAARTSTSSRAATATPPVPMPVRTPTPTSPPPRGTGSGRAVMPPSPTANDPDSQPEIEISLEPEAARRAPRDTLADPNLRPGDSIPPLPPAPETRAKNASHGAATLPPVARPMQRPPSRPAITPPTVVTRPVPTEDGRARRESEVIEVYAPAPPSVDAPPGENRGGQYSVNRPKVPSRQPDPVPSGLTRPPPRPATGPVRTVRGESQPIPKPIGREGSPSPSADNLAARPRTPTPARTPPVGSPLAARTPPPAPAVVVTRPAVIVGAPQKPAIPAAPRVRKAREEEGRGFGQGLISEKSLDEVILAYLSEDAEEK
jgi:hypothetical protein